MQGQPAIKGMQWISIGAIIIGLLFIVAGSITTGIAYTEITPPNYDDNYDRYIGSSVPRLMGPFILAFGAIIILGSCGIMILESKQNYQRLPVHNGDIKHYQQQSQPPPPAHYGKDDTESIPSHKNVDH